MMKSSLTIAGIYQNLTKISNFATDWAIKASFDERSVYAVELAVDEACSNIIEHAYGGEGKGDIDLHCQILDDSLRVTIKDRGRPFNPDIVGPPDFQAPLEERIKGGLGLFLIKQLMDEVVFTFGENGNILVLVKKQGTVA